MRFFKIGKAWTGVIIGGTVGAMGVVAASLWGKHTVKSGTNNIIDTFINGYVNIGTMNATIDIGEYKTSLTESLKALDVDNETMKQVINIVEFSLTQPIPITIKNISFAVSEMLTPSMWEIIRNGPSVLGDFAAGFLGEQGSILLLAALCAASAGVYAYKKTYSVSKVVAREQETLDRLINSESRADDVDATSAGTMLDADENPVSKGNGMSDTIINISGPESQTEYQQLPRPGM